jgi:choline dehydrogenase-like flavoprotein
VVPRPEVHRPGWPIAYEELTPWYEAAQATCELGPYTYDASTWFDAFGQRPPSLGSNAAVGLYRLSPPTRFGTRYRQDLEGDDRCTAILHATAVALVTTPDGGHVRSVDAVSSSGARLSFEAEVVVVATGGIDAPRLLLLSSGVSTAGVANATGLVGVGFMEHPHQRVRLSVTLDAGVAALFYPHKGVGEFAGSSGLAMFALTNDTVRERGVFNAALALAYRLADTETSADQLGLGVNELLAGGGRSPVAVMAILRSEQSPVTEHVVRLGKRRDLLGLPVAEVSWNVDPATLDSMRTSLGLLADAIGQSGLGRVQVSPGNKPVGANAMEIGCHHLGTTRMADDPSQGVVDRDCRCHQVDNLYVAGSAVFPSGGYANPTLTIVALAHRLGDTLSMRLTGAPSPLGR